MYRRDALYVPMERGSRLGRSAAIVAVLLAAVFVASAVLVTGPGQIGTIGSRGGGQAPAGWPVPRPVFGASPAFSGHYYAGGFYNGTTRTATIIQMTMTIPDDYPNFVTDGYFAILSAWDNAASYDQLGITVGVNNSDNLTRPGEWFVAYSTTTFCAGSYNTNPNATQLQPGQTYTFDMLVSGGVVTFEVFHGSSMVTHATHTTGGTYFSVSTLFECQSTFYYDYTVYEEVYDSAGPLVPYDFVFANNTANGTAVTSWYYYLQGSPVPSWRILISGSTVTVANEPYYLRFTSGADKVSTENVAPHANAVVGLTVGSYLPTGTVHLSVYSMPGGWTASFSANNQSGPFASSLTVVPYYGGATGSFLVGINATNGTGGFAHLTLTVKVCATLTTYLNASASSIKVGKTSTLTYTIHGGATPVTWTLTESGVSGNLSGASGGHYIFTGTKAGMFTFTFTATDALGVVSQATTTVVVKK